jgi:Putative peptidoglycan binding domain/L,D-transpeptidase catalytic domain
MGTVGVSLRRKPAADRNLLAVSRVWRRGTVRGGGMRRGDGHRRVCALLAAGLVAVVLAGCSSTSGGGGQEPTAAASSRSATDTTSPTGSPTAVTTTTAPTSGAPSGTGTPTTSPTQTPTPTPTPTPTSTPTPTPTQPPTDTADAMLRRGATGPRVLAVQQRLADLGYWLGTPDGHYGDVTAQAVTALQKAAGLQRDGVLGPRTRAALERGVRPSARSTGGGRVVEVDLERQLLLVVEGGEVRRILNASTGSGAYYSAPGSTVVKHAVTPRGHYAVFRGVDAWDTSPLGHLYRPRYFNGGIAVHGYPSVPAVPASHGCVRVSLPAMDMIWSEGLMPRREAVWVY